MPPACWSQESLDVLSRCLHHVVFATLLSPKYTLNCPAALDVGRRSEIDAAYQEGSAEYLQSIGIESKGEIARILDIAHEPKFSVPYAQRQEACHQCPREYTEISRYHRAVFMLCAMP